MPKTLQREARVLAGATRLVSDAFGDIAPEDMVDEPLDLPAMAAATNGRVLSASGTPTAGGGTSPFALTRLRPALLLAALLLFLTELVYRRWPR